MKKLYFIFLLLCTVIIVGVLGFSVLEGLRPLDALYMTIITVSTVGFNEVVPLTDAGKLFTVFLILCSAGSFTYALALVASFIIEGQFGYITRRIKMEKNIAMLSDHYIVCGYSRVALAVIKDLKKAGSQFIVVLEAERANDIPPGVDYLYLSGDPTSDDVLLHAQITNAKGLISCLESDKENLFVVISARSLNPELTIATVAKDESSFNKMLKAGADNVILPEVIGGKRMVSMILHPNVLSFLDVMTTTKTEGLSLKLEEITIPEASSLIDKSLADAKIPQKTGLLVVAIRQKIGYMFNPSSSTIMSAGDVLIVLGEGAQIGKLKEYVLN